MKLFSAFARFAFVALALAPFTAKADSPNVSALLWSSHNPSTVGDAVTFSTLVIGAGSVPTGTVAFKRYSTTINSDVTLQTVGAGLPIAGGTEHTCYVNAAGGVMCAGNNAKGQLGDGTTTERHTFVAVVGLSTAAIGVSARAQNTCALLVNSTVMCWGSNSSGQLGTGAATDSSAHSTPAAVAGLSDVKTIAVGSAHACALTNQGKVYCWGQAVDGQIGNGNSNLSNKLSPVAVTALSSGITALSAGDDFNCALTSAGGVKCWGHNFYGTVGSGDAGFEIYSPQDVSGLTSGVIAIGSGQELNCAALATGGAQCWGYDASMQLGDGTTGDTNHTRRTPVTVLNLTDVLASIGGGYNHACALTTGGAVYCWGSQQGGQLGDNVETDTTANATQVIGLSSGATSLGSGDYHACAGQSDGSAVCWGWDFNGQQGDNTTGTNKTPVASAGAGAMLGIASASTTTSALVVDTSPITAVYSGDGTFSGVTSNTVDQFIQGLTSTTTITSNTPNPSVVGATVTVNVTVSGSSTPPDGGVITLHDENSNAIAFGSVTNGSASLTVSTLDAGAHTLTAFFSGDNVYGTSQSASVSQTVQGATTLSLTATPTLAGAGDSVMISATVGLVAPATGTPTGTLSFVDAGTEIRNTALLSGGPTTVSVNLSVGTHVVAVTYSGDATFLGSTKNVRIVVKANVGLQKLVSATPGFAQHQPKIAALKKGYVVTWVSDNQDSGGKGVFAQRYSPLGVKIGSEFQVNTTHVGDQTDPVAAGLVGGTFVVAWQSAGQDGSGTGIYMQRYSIAGAPSGNELRVNTTKTNDQSQPAIAALSDGGYIITWTSSGQDGSGLGIYAQRYLANGQKVGSEFKVNTTTTGDQSHPAVAALGTGFVVTWQGPDASGLGIVAQRFDSTSAPVGTELKPNIVTTSDQSLPAVAQLADGRFVITWQSNLQDLDGLGIYAQIYTSAGARSGSNVRVNTKRTGDQASPAVAAFSDRGFVVTWTSDGQDGSGQGIFGQVFTNDGQAVNSELRINTQTAGDQTEPAVAAFSGGTFVTVWTDNGGSDADIYSQRAVVPVPGGS